MLGGSVLFLHTGTTALILAAVLLIEKRAFGTDLDLAAGIESSVTSDRTLLADLVSNRQPFVELRTEISDRLRNIRYQLRDFDRRIHQLQQQMNIIESQYVNQIVLKEKMELRLALMDQERSELDDFRQQLIRQLSEIDMDIASLDKEIRQQRERLKSEKRT